MRNVPFWALERQLETRTTNTLTTRRSHVGGPPIAPACARTHAFVAWEPANSSAIVFGLPRALRLGGKTWRQARA